MKGTPKPEELIDRLTAPHYAAPIRLSAFGYYYWYGTPQQLNKLVPFEQDKMKTPKCKEGATGCEWRCTVGEGKQASDQEITNVGEFVRYCVEPAMAKRTKPDKTGEEGAKPQ
jgi:hypothetical protein